MHSFDFVVASDVQHHETSDCSGAEVQDGKNREENLGVLILCATNHAKTTD